MNEFNLHIIEADSDFYNGKCISLVIPTTEGMYGIQANHESMVAAVAIGVVKYTLPDGKVIEPEKLYISAYSVVMNVCPSVSYV